MFWPAPIASQEKPNKFDLKLAARAYDQGRRAEAGGDWRAAFDAYSQAAGLVPANREYLLQRERARFGLVQNHVDRAEQAALAGDLLLARAELHAALKLDPGYSVAQERLQQFESRASHYARVEPPLATIAEPQLQPQPGARSFDYRGNTLGLFEEIAQKFGVTVSFDEGLRVRQVRFRVEDVDFLTAVNLAAQQTYTFWRALDTKMFFVAENTPQKRRDFAPVVLRTVVMPNSATPEQLTELLRLVREIAGIGRTQLDTRTRTLTLRDTPENIELAMALIEQLDQARGEMMLEVNILEVDRQNALKLGILPPSSTQIFTISPQDLDALQSAQSSPQALADLLRRIFGTQGGNAFDLASLVPPLIAFGGGRTVALATLPGAAADFSQTFSVLRRARRMLLRSGDGQPASFFIGERFPINLAVLSSNFIPGVSPGIEGAPILQSQFEAGDGPVDVILRDFNADTFLDAALANQPADEVSILLGNGDGTFGAPNTISVGDEPVALAAGDFDADGDLDMAVANRAANTISILLNDGSAAFTAGATLTTGTSPRALLAGNLDSNTQLDLAVVNDTDNSASVFAGNGDGTFAARVDFPTGAGPVAVIIADFNNDTFADLATANQTANTVSVLLGDGAGTFAAATDFATGNGPRALAAAGFDSGTALDIVTANESDDTVSILLGNGDGTFGAASDFTVGDGPVDVVAADFDGLGNLDVAVVNQIGDTVSVLLGAGDGTFGLRADFLSGDAPSALDVGNLNTDGRVDLVIANRDADSITVILNSVSGILPPGALQPQPYPAFQYEDLGLKVKATPRMHPGNEVTLQLQFEIRSRSAEDLNGIPVISNRTLEHTVRLRENEMTVLAGIVQREERRGITGWPGLANTPGVSRVLSSRDSDGRETELLITITPRRLRLLPRVEKSIYAGRDPAGVTGSPVQQPPQ